MSYRGFREFYPFYLGEHRHPLNRALHFAGDLLVLALLAYAAASGRWLWLLALPAAGYGPAWAGHFFFEHNRPATFRYPLLSLIADWVMFKDLLTGRQRFSR